MPVSAALYEAVQKHSAQFEQWRVQLRTIPQDIFDAYLSKMQDAWDGKYDTALVKKCPNLLDVSIRRQMKNDIPWGVFRAIIKTLYKSNSATEATQELLKLSNFKEVRRVLRDQFFARAKAIKCTVLLSQLNKILLLIRNDALYTLKRSAKKSEEWIKLIEKNIRPNDASSAAELTAFIRSNIKSSAEIERIEKAIMSQLVLPLEQLMIEIEQTNKDYKMLQVVHRMKDAFGTYYEELCTLFGMYGSKPQLSDEQKMNRQMFWQSKSMRYADPQMQEVAYYAASSYGKL